jgi:hypothetical protein
VRSVRVSGRLVGRIHAKSAYLTIPVTAIAPEVTLILRTSTPKTSRAHNSPRPAVPCISPNILATFGLDQSLCAHFTPRFLPARRETNAVEYAPLPLTPPTVWSVAPSPLTGA